MLERLARDIGFDGSELDEFSKLDMLDRGSILARRFRAQGKQFHQEVAALFADAEQHSLLHAYLSNLPASEAITQNYDTLFERAAEGADSPVATLPYSSGDHHERWLLKMHGCVTRPSDIVIQREDYIRYSQRRAALSGIVGATMLTRWMLFVGFSLRDGNFHRAVDDVRRAAGDRPMSRIGTALFVTPSDLTAELWQEELDILSFGEPRSGPPGAWRSSWIACWGAFGIEQTLDDHLRRNAGMVRAGLPQRRIAAHAVIPRICIHDRDLERMPHMQRAGYIRRRDHDAERIL